MCHEPYSSLEFELPVPLTAQQIAKLVRDVTRQVDWDEDFRTEATFIGRRRLHLSRAFELGMEAVRPEYNIRVVPNLRESKFRLYDEGCHILYSSLVVTSHAWSIAPDPSWYDDAGEDIDKAVEYFHTNLVDYIRHYYSNPNTLEHLDWDDIDAPDPVDQDDSHT